MLFFAAFSLLLTLTVGCNRSSAPTAGATAAVTDLAVPAFAEMIDDRGVVILDVRTPAETAEGVIVGAQEIDFREPDFAEQIAQLDKDKTYLVYCRSGNRSGQATQLMAEMGFKHLYNLTGGYVAWAEAGQPTE
jgi:rhodanese-related sulfurtransferase